MEHIKLIVVVTVEFDEVHIQSPGKYRCNNAFTLYVMGEVVFENLIQYLKVHVELAFS